MILHAFKLKAAIHLNNTGVTLASSHLFESATKCYSDATAVMKATCLSPPSMNRKSASDFYDIDRVTIQDIEERLQACARLLCEAKPQLFSGNVTHNVTIKIVSDMESPAQAALSEAAVYRMIHVEPVNFDDFFESDMAVESSIILYNYAVCFLCIASQASNIQ